eukprot:m.296287 g.296287  ORF g.296287 m.296287 type:complete len:79 (+) comp22976_c0_seq14:1477-1713(+)
MPMTPTRTMNLPIRATVVVLLLMLLLLSLLAAWEVLLLEGPVAAADFSSGTVDEAAAGALSTTAVEAAGMGPAALKSG